MRVSLTFPVWCAGLIILLGFFKGDPVIEIPDYIVFVLFFFWVAVGLIFVELGVIIKHKKKLEKQLDRYDDLKLTKLEKISMEDLHDLTQVLERIAETLDSIDTRLWDLMKHRED